MTARQKRLAFVPGFTTKTRGWGIGLTFCKRIIEDYHDSKIYIKETAPGKGTTFAIELPNKFPQLQ
jgi:signal transduction histidine kinase